MSSKEHGEPETGIKLRRNVAFRQIPRFNECHLQIRIFFRGVEGGRRQMRRCSAVTIANAFSKRTAPLNLLRKCKLNYHAATCMSEGAG